MAVTTFIQMESAQYFEPEIGSYVLTREDEAVLFMAEDNESRTEASALG